MTEVKSCSESEGMSPFLFDDVVILVKFSENVDNFLHFPLKSENGGLSISRDVLTFKFLSFELYLLKKK